MTSVDMTALTMRSFLTSSGDEPLNANRLRFADRKMCDEFEIKSFLTNGHRKGMTGASGGAGSGTNPRTDALIHSPAAMSGAFGFGLEAGVSSKPSSAFKPTPTIAVNGRAGVTTNGIVPELTHRQTAAHASRPRAHMCDEEEENGRASSCSDRAADNEVSETLKSSESGDNRNSRDRDRIVLVPTKWQVLYFVAHTKALRIKRTGCELQVTDTANFPLFDVFQKSHCFRSTWILETYGRQVLVITDSSKSFSATRRSDHPAYAVINSENEDMGYFLSGDPFTIQNPEKTVVARYTSFESTIDPRLRNWQCILDGTGQEICVLEQRKPSVHLIKFSGQLGFSLKLMVLAAAVQIAACPNMQKKNCCTLM